MFHRKCKSYRFVRTRGGLNYDNYNFWVATLYILYDNPKICVITFNAVVMNTDEPMSRKMTRPVSLCSLIPRNRGCSPGAELSDSSFRLLTWLIDRTVAATNQGNPIREHTASIAPTTRRSKWYPQPFYVEEIENTLTYDPYNHTHTSSVKDNSKLNILAVCVPCG